MGPRVGVAVALASVVLVFGFFFAVAGVRGEQLHGVPLLLVGALVMLPGAVVIAVIRRTRGCRYPPAWLAALAQRGRRGVTAGTTAGNSATGPGESAVAPAVLAVSVGGAVGERISSGSISSGSVARPNARAEAPSVTGGD
ncbi:unnamed protein product [Lampetra planeri]